MYFLTLLSSSSDIPYLYLYTYIYTSELNISSTIVTSSKIFSFAYIYIYIYYIYLYICVCVCVCVCVCLRTSPSIAGCEIRSVFKRSLPGLNSAFSFSLIGFHNMVNEASLPDYSSITGGRIVECIPFLRILAIWETTLFRIRTRFALLLFYNDNQKCLLFG